MADAPSTMTAQPGLLPVPGADPDVPLLALDLGLSHVEQALAPQARTRLRTAALGQLQEIGLEPVTPARLLPGPARGTWSAHFSRGRLELRSPTHLVYEGTLAAWPAYTAAITANGWVLLHIGHLALGWGADALQAVRTAAERGEALGGIVPARCT